MGLVMHCQLRIICITNAYAYNNYMQGVKAANRENKINMGGFFLNSMASYGAPKDIDYCISESRRGIVDTMV